jgi:hypothetical protein
MKNASVISVTAESLLFQNSINASALKLCGFNSHLPGGAVGQDLLGREELDDVIADGEQAVHLAAPHGPLLRRQGLQPVAAPKNGGCEQEEAMSISVLCS